MQRFNIFLLLGIAVILFMSSCSKGELTEDTIIEGKNYKDELENEGKILDKEYKDKLAFVDKKFHFETLKDPSKLDSFSRKKYEFWKYDWKDRKINYDSKVEQIREVNFSYVLWILSIIIGLVLLGGALSEIIDNKRKWWKVLQLIFWGWLGTSCYAYIFMIFPYFPDGYMIWFYSFFSISFQLKFFPFLMIWVLNCIYIYLMYLSVVRTLRRFIYLAIMESSLFELMNNITNAIPGLKDLTPDDVKKRDVSWMMFLVYALISCGLIGFYFYENPVMEWILNFRANLANAFDISEVVIYTFILFIFISIGVALADDLKNDYDKDR